MSFVVDGLASAAVVAGGAGYGLLVRLVLDLPGVRDRLDRLSFGFVFGLPAGVGFAAGLVGTALFAGLMGPAVVLPVLSVGLFALGLRLCGCQRMLSLVMALPVFLAMAVAGGLLANRLLAVTANPAWIAAVCGVVLAFPIVCVAVENLLPAREVLRWVRTSQVVRARPRDVWQSVVRVAPIQPREWRLYRIFAWLGFPAPERAVLSHDGPGGLRQGIFSGRVLFDEPVLVWKPYSLVRFSVRVQPRSLADLPFDEFTRLGGRYFDVVAAEYHIEPLDDEHVRVHLNSLYRLTSRLNFYPGWWARLVLRTFQGSILALVKRRCEEAVEPPPSAPVTLPLFPPSDSTLVLTGSGPNGRGSKRRAA
jgi:hypothetical protein